MPTIKELTEGIDPEPQPVSQAPARPMAQPDDVFSFILKGLHDSPTNGNRNNFIHSFASDCNRFGIDESECFNHCQQWQERDFTANEIRQAVKSAYSRTNEHATKTYNPIERREKQSPQATHPPLAKKNIFLVRTMNQCLNDAKTAPIPKKLFSNFWNEGELSILFSGTGAGKTILSVQIADAITTGKSAGGFPCEVTPQTVLYFDFELSEKQQEKRYSDNYTSHYQFSDLLKRIEIHPDAEDFSEENLYSSIEETVNATGAKILIVDNVTYLKNNLETSKDALPLMKFLKRLKKKYGLSILCLAHTPKRDLTRAISVNDLAGSSQLSNFADSIFTINFSAKDTSLRYLKEIKTRQSEKIFDSDNVITCEIGNESNFTSFKIIGYCKESEHLMEMTDDKKTEIEIAVIELKKANPYKSLRDIARELGVSKNKVDRILKSVSHSGTAGTASNPYEHW